LLSVAKTAVCLPKIICPVLKALPLPTTTGNLKAFISIFSGVLALKNPRPLRLFRLVFLFYIYPY
jgi:hypothetical protein